MSEEKKTEFTKAELNDLTEKFLSGVQWVTDEEAIAIQRERIALLESQLAAVTAERDALLVEAGHGLNGPHPRHKGYYEVKYEQELERAHALSEDNESLRAELDAARRERPRNGDWWCPQCQVGLHPSRVTFEERCDTCGTPVSVGGVSLEQENATLRAALDCRDAEIERLKAIGTPYQRDRDERNALVLEVDRLRAEVAELKATVASLSSDLKGCTDALAESKHERDERVNQLDSLLRDRQETISRLHERLEDNHTFDTQGNRVPCEPGTIPDGIECRDETIRLQRDHLDTLGAESEKWEKSFHEMGKQYLAEAALRLAAEADVAILTKRCLEARWIMDHGLDEYWQEHVEAARVNSWRGGNP